MKFALSVRPFGRKAAVNQKVVVSAVFVAAMFMNIMDVTNTPFASCTDVSMPGMPGSRS